MHGHDVGDHGHIGQGGHPRHEVLAEGGVGAQYMAVACVFGKGYDLRGQYGGHGVFVGLIVYQMHVGHTGQFRGFVGDGLAVVGQHQHLDIATNIGGARYRTARGIQKLAVVMIGNDKNLVAHIRLFSFSLATSSSTVSTMMPPARLGGALVVTVSMGVAAATSSSSKARASIGFFLAFMMLGSFR